MERLLSSTVIYGHMVSSIIFLFVVGALVLSKTKMKDKMDFVKVHKVLGGILIVYMIGYSLIDYFQEKDFSILLIIPFLIGIGLTGRMKTPGKKMYLHAGFTVGLLVTLLLHVFKVI